MERNYTQVDGVSDRSFIGWRQRSLDIVARLDLTSADNTEEEEKKKYSEMVITVIKTPQRWTDERTQQWTKNKKCENKILQITSQNDSRRDICPVLDIFLFSSRGAAAREDERHTQWSLLLT